MMKFYQNFIRTFTDVPNHTTLLVHSLSGCPLYCFGCHNYDEIIAHTPAKYKTADDLFLYLKKSGFLFDAIMFSGGEFLIDPFIDIRAVLQRTRELFAGKIIVTTSGLYHRKVQQLYKEKLVDGIHIDMKLPYHVLDPEADQSIFQDIMGIKPSRKMVANLLASIDQVITHNSPLDQVRTVRYPILDEGFFEEIQRYIDQRKAEHQSEVDYFLNDFLYT